MRTAFKVTQSMAEVPMTGKEEPKEYMGSAEFVVLPNGRPPAEKVKYAAEEKKTSEEDAKSAVEEKKTSEEDAKSAVEEKKTPADEAESSVEEKKTPAEEAESSVEEKKTPAEEAESSVEEKKAPAEQREDLAETRAAEADISRAAERMQQAAKSMEALAGQDDMEEKLQYMKNVMQWIDYVEQSMQKLEEQTDRLDRKISDLRISQNPAEVYRKVLRPLAEWVQTWQEIARDQSGNAEEITARIDEAAGVIEKECRMCGVRRYRSQSGDLFDGERMMADEDVVETNDAECSGKIIESLGDGWEMNGQSFFDERVRAYRYVEKSVQ